MVHCHPPEVLYCNYNGEIWLSNLTFKSWISTSEKRGPSCPNWGHGGGGVWGFGEMPERKRFFSLTPSLSDTRQSTRSLFLFSPSSVVKIPRMLFHTHHSWTRTPPSQPWWSACLTHQMGVNIQCKGTSTRQRRLSFSHSYSRKTCSATERVVCFHYAPLPVVCSSEALKAWFCLWPEGQIREEHIRRTSSTTWFKSSLLNSGTRPTWFFI